ncbi:hypothetical protein [Streptomyces griseoloalbus]|uniref:Uncharacterized protein n=1 Tax=Streptomyces griseoloalbus TaxID=67303 RepID=A0A7W8FCY6_9ACTN|nr:hypothetical protein [Streptomyces albaduncus]MBB5129829.1 hypothetical protein [Streptomyces albaduncus]GGW80864.1 hypothetical protein GCM10010340_68730 [Streptomyces albaduncus]
MAAISVGSVEVDVVPNTRGIRAQLQASLVPAANQVGDEIGRIIGRHVSTQIAQAVRSGVTAGGRTATPQAARSGEQAGGAFGRTFRSRVQAAMQNLPRADVRIDETGFNADMARLRARLETLSNKRIGVDVDAGTALAEVERLQEQLRRLGAEHPDVNVRVDTGQAIAELEALRAEINRLDGRTANVDVDTRSAAANLRLLSTAAITFGPAIIPALPVVAAGLGAVAAAATAAAVGIGSLALVAVPAFVQMGKVMQAQKAAQDAATNATLKGGQAASQGASRALQMASAQQSLASAHRTAARQIRQAEQSVAEAVRSASEANQRAKEQVAEAVRQAAERQRQAAEQVRSAEESLADAQRSARQAQQDLTQARRDAAQELAELETRLTNAQLSERDAVLSVEEARNRLRAVQASGSRASLLEQQRAQLAYDQAVQRLQEQQAETKSLTSQKKAADKAGIEGSKTVQDAQERLRKADEAVTDQQRELARARQDAARQQVEAQEAVAEAQRNVARTQEDGARSVARAQEQLAEAQQSAADSIASAQRQIASASLSAAGGVDQAAIAQAKYKQELAKLTPAARETFDAFLSLKGAFGQWSRSLQPAVMPIFTRALNGLKNSLPGLTPFVLEAADAISGLQDRASRGFKSPWWKEFKQDLAGSIKPAITGLGIAFGNTFKGMAGVMQAFFPHMDSISQRMQDITGRFANWGTSLKGSPEFERFLDYSSEMGPVLADTFGKIGTALVDIGQGLKPVSKPLLQLLGGMASGVSSLATHVPELVIGLWGLLVVTRLWRLALVLTTGAMAVFNAISMAGPWGWIALAIAGVVLAVLYLYRRFSWFRDAVQAVWNAIKAGAMWLWNNALKPAFDGIVAALKKVGSWATWLWQNAIKPAWDAIVLAGKILLTALVTIVLLPIIAAIKLVGWVAKWLWSNALKPAFDAIAAAAMWLWNNAFKPAFQWIGDKAKWLWNNAIKPAWAGIQAGAKWMWEKVIRPIFRSFMDGLKTLGGWAKWLYKEAIKPAWDGIVAAGKWAWEKGIKPIFDGWKKIIRGLGGVFEDAVGAIKTQWDKLKGVAKRPVNFVVDTVYNKGIVAVWNKVASAFGAPKLKEFQFASGGIMPGYTPGRDVHRFVSPTGGRLELSGGEAIMRPEFTRAVGAGFVGTMNSIARSHGAQGVKAALAPMLGGNPPTPTDTSLRYAGGGIYPVQRFADGGIFGWIKDRASDAVGAGSAAWNKIKEGASWLGDTLEASARAGVKNVVNPLLRNFPGMDTGFGRMIRRIPTRIIDTLFGYSKEADKRGAGGIGGPRIAAALKWAKTQAGKPYQWAGNGNPSWDCSGFMSAIESVIRGQKPHRRWATMAFSGRTGPPGWVKNGNSAFRIGITNAGVGHTAGTLGKTNVESRGGDGVVVGSRARGYKDSLFTDWYGFMPGKYDNGGMLQPGFNLAYNGTGRPEPVLTGSQFNALARGSQQLGDLQVNVYVGDQQITDIARAEVRTAQGELIQVLNAV